MIPKVHNQLTMSMNCAFATVMCNLGVTLWTLWPTCEIIIETAVELRKMKIFQIRLKLQRWKHLQLKISSIKISIWRFYFSVSITPIWTLVQNITHLNRHFRHIETKPFINLYKTLPYDVVTGGSINQFKGRLGRWSKNDPILYQNVRSRK